MVSAPLRRRGFLAGVGGLGVAGLLGACATGSDDNAGTASSTLTLVCSNAAPHHPMWQDVALQRRCNDEFRENR